MKVSTAKYLLMGLITATCIGFGACNEEEVAETCTDGIQNQDETGVDCGGSCTPCAICATESGSATVGGASYTATNIMGNSQGSNIIVSLSNVTAHNVNLSINEDVTAGTYDISGSFGTATSAGGQYSDLTTAPPALYQATSGTLVITEHNTDTDEITGTFSFQATQMIGGSGTVSVTNGAFCVAY